MKFLKTASIVFCFTLMAGIAAYAHTVLPSTAPQINVDMSPEDKQTEAAYSAAAQNLSPGQQEILKTMDMQYTRKVTGYSAVVMGSGVAWRYCSEHDPDILKDKQGYQSKYGAYINGLQAAQNANRAQIQKQDAVEAPFIDQDLLQRHQMVFEKVTTNFGTQMFQRVTANANYNPKCDDLKTKLNSGGGDAARMDEVKPYSPQAAKYQLTDEDKQGEKAFAEAVQNASPKQQQKLQEWEKLERHNGKSELLNTILVLSWAYCATNDPAISQAKDHYRPIFTMYLAGFQAAENDEKQRVSGLTDEASVFVDQKLLLHHQALYARLMHGASAKLMADSQQAGGYKGANCTEMERHLGITGASP